MNSLSVSSPSISILHEELKVKRLHCKKMLREIQTLRHGGLYTECDNVIDHEYALGAGEHPMRFSASQKIETLEQEKEALNVQIRDIEAKMEELISRPQIEEHQQIVEKAEWEALVEEKERLASQVDELEARASNLQQQAIPAQEKKEREEQLKQLILELEAQKESDEQFGDVIRVREWSVDEVCWFLQHKGLGDYIPGIREHKVNGEMLMEDTTPEFLSTIGVKRIHIKQVERQVQVLRHSAFGYEPDDNVLDFYIEPEEYAVDKNANYEAQIAGLQEELAESQRQFAELTEAHDALGDEKKSLLEEQNRLEQTIESLKEQIENLKAQKALELEDATKAQIEALNAQIEGLNETVSANQDSYEEERKETENVHQEALQERQQRIEELEGNKEELETKLSDAQQTIEEYVDKERIAREEEEAKDNSYEAQLRRKARDDPTFGVLKRAHKWSIEEVSHWLYTVKIPEYVDAFKEQVVDGEMLLSDLSAEQLRSDLNIKQYHVGRISREIKKLKELALPPLGESDFFESTYVPPQSAVETIGTLEADLSDQKDINSALNMEIEKLKEQYETIKEIQAMGSEWQTPGGPAAADDRKEDGDHLGSPAVAAGGAADGAMGSGAGTASSEEVEKLQNANAELLDTLQQLQKSKMDLAMRTADEMQKLRRMLTVASRAYEEVTGTPIGQVAQWRGTQNLFYKTLGLGGSSKSPSPNHHHRGHQRHNSMDSYRGGYHQF